MNPVAYESIEPCSELRPFVRRFIVARGGGLENAVMQLSRQGAIISGGSTEESSPSRPISKPHESSVDCLTSGR